MIEGAENDDIMTMATSRRRRHEQKLAEIQALMMNPFSRIQQQATSTKNKIWAPTTGNARTTTSSGITSIWEQEKDKVKQGGTTTSSDPDERQQPSGAHKNEPEQSKRDVVSNNADDGTITTATTSNDASLSSSHSTTDDDEDDSPYEERLRDLEDKVRIMGQLAVQLAESQAARDDLEDRLVAYEKRLEALVQENYQLRHERQHTIIGSNSFHGVSQMGGGRKLGSRLFHRLSPGRIHHPESSSVQSSNHGTPTSANKYQAEKESKSFLLNHNLEQQEEQYLALFEDDKDDVDEKVDEDDDVKDDEKKKKVASEGAKILFV